MYIKKGRKLSYLQFTYISRDVGNISKNRLYLSKMNFKQWSFDGSYPNRYVIKGGRTSNQINLPFASKI